MVTRRLCRRGRPGILHVFILVPPPLCAVMARLAISFSPSPLARRQNSKTKANANDKTNEQQERQDEDDSVFLGDKEQIERQREPK